MCGSFFKKNLCLKSLPLYKRSQRRPIVTLYLRKCAQGVLVQTFLYTNPYPNTMNQFKKTYLPNSL